MSYAYGPRNLLVCAIPVSILMPNAHAPSQVIYDYLECPADIGLCLFSVHCTV